MSALFKTEDVGVFVIGKIMTMKKQGLQPYEIHKNLLKQGEEIALSNVYFIFKNYKTTGRTRRGEHEARRNARPSEDEEIAS